MTWVYYKYELPNGTFETRKKWVADPKPAKKRKKGPRRSTSRAAAQRSARLAAQRRAAALSARKRADALRRTREIQQRVARQAAIARARREAYEELIRRQKEITRKAGIIKDQNAAKVAAATKPKAPPEGPSTIQAEKLASRRILQQKAAAEAEKQRIAKQNAADAQRWQAYAAEQERRRALQGRAGDVNSAKALERQLQLAKEEAAKNGYARTEYLKQVQAQYEKHAALVYSRIERYRAQLDALEKAGNTAGMRRLLSNAGFRQTVAEFNRLYVGKGKSPLSDGTYRDFYKNFDDVSKSQRTWWKSQMKASLQSEYAGLLREQRAGENVDRQLKIVQAQIDAFNGKTSYDKDAGRYRTLDEELDHQRALIMMEQQKIATQRGAAERQRKADLIRHGMAEYKGQIVRRDDIPVLDSVERIVREQYGGKAPSFKRAQDLQGFADKVVADWEKAHPAPARDRKNMAPFQEWWKARQAYEERVYGIFGSTTPEFWERVVSAPGISHAIAALGVPLASIGAFGRVGSAVLTGQSKVGGSAVTVADAPEDIKKKAQAYALAEMRKVDPNANLAQLANNGQMRQKFTQYLQNWLASPEGKKWADEQNKQRTKASQEQDLAFASGFYGSGDIGDKVDALNAYGFEPGQLDEANLLFQLLADPSNAIPLKFTTYLARGKYALEAAEAAKGLTKPTAKAAAFAKSFLGVDEGTLTLRRALGSFEKEFEKSGLSVESFVERVRERVAGIRDKGVIEEEFRKALREVGLDSRLVESSHISNLVEHFITQKVDDAAIPRRSRLHEIEADAKAAIKKSEEAERARNEALQKEASKISSQETRALREGNAERARLTDKRVRQESDLRTLSTKKSARVPPPEAGAATPTKVTPEPARNNPLASGATDNRVAEAESKKLSKLVRDRKPHPRYDAADEFFTVDEVGNRLPLTFTPDAEYRRLVKLAKDGDSDAREQLVNRSRYERNRFRTEQEDILVDSNIRRSDVRFAPTKFDFAERAGTVSDEVATERLIYDRKIIRHLRRVVAATKAGDDNIRAWLRPHRTSKNPHPIVDRDFEAVSRLNEYGDLQHSARGHVEIGQQIINARESLAGTKRLYDTFTHDATEYYEGLVGRDLTGISKRDFVRIMLRLGQEHGLAEFRDGGQLIFEIFHQLRLAKDWDKLRQFSDVVSQIILSSKREDNLMGWMWKAMEERSGMFSYSMHHLDIQEGFYEAAEAWGLHPELAFSAIPNGYYAKSPPISFGLRGHLQNLTDAGTRFDVPPKNYTTAQAKREVTQMMLGGSGSPTRVLGYVAERFGDFIKAGEIRVRLKDELVYAAALHMGREGLTEAIMKHLRGVSDEIIQTSQRKGEPLRDLLDLDIQGKLDTWGRKLGPGKRPVFPDFRDAVQEAYWAGDLEGIPARGHTMMFLAGVQTNPDAWFGMTKRYAAYMEEIGGQEFADAKALIHDIFHDRIRLAFSRIYREGPNVPRSAEEEFWKKMYPNASASELLDYAKAREKQFDELEGDFALEVEREKWLQNDSPRPMDDYNGTVDSGRFVENVKSTIADIRRYGERAHLVNSLEGQIRSFLERHIAQAAGNTDQITLNEIKSAIRAIEKYPEAKRMVNKLQEELGLVRLQEIERTVQLRGLDGEVIERLGHAKQTTLAKGEPKPKEPVRGTGKLPDDEAGLRAHLKSITDESGTIKKGFEDEARRVNLAIEKFGQHKEPGFDELKAQLLAQQVGPAASSSAPTKLRAGGGSPRDFLAAHSAGNRYRLRDGSTLEVPSGFAPSHIPHDGILTGANGVQFHVDLLDDIVDSSGNVVWSQKTPSVASAASASSPAQTLAAEPSPLDYALPSADTAARSQVEQLYQHIFDMSESEWLAFEKQRANRVLRDPKSSPSRKSYARAHIRSIRKAEAAIKMEKEHGVHIPWRERAAYREQVITRYGEDAKKYIAPRAIAPLVTSMRDAVVEQGRTYWRLLQSAAPHDVPTPVKGITHRGEKLDHIPKHVYDEVEQEVSDAVRRVHGYGADTLTRTRHRGKLTESQKPLGRLSDNDPKVIAAKKRALAAYAKRTGYHISLDAYDEARKVLWKGFVQNKTAKRLLAEAKRAVKAAGGDINDKALLEEHVLRIRKEWAEEEAIRQLGGLAWKEMFGHSPESIMAQFISRYTDDTQLKHFVPELSPFQRRTLEEHIKDLVGTDNLDDSVMGEFLGAANKPPFEAGRKATREFLERIGAWSPRTAEDFTKGAKSWSVTDEAKFWRDNYGYVPPWADPARLSTEFSGIFHDIDEYYRHMKEWGVINRGTELKAKLEGKTAQDIEEEFFQSGRRDIEEQRRYVIERYGELVSKDGHTLDAMPWLMHDDEYRHYLGSEMAKNLPEGFIQTPKELDEVTRLIAGEVERHWDEYITSASKTGPVTTHDIFKMTSAVLATLLAKPKWAARHRDIFGKGLRAWAWFNRALIFSNPAFLVTNAIDAPLKTAYYRFTRRGLFNSGLARGGPGAEWASKLTPEGLGMDLTSAIYREAQSTALDRIKHPRGYTDMERALDRGLAGIQGVFHDALPAAAGRIEKTFKMKLALEMAPEVYEQALKRFGDPELADAFARDFIKKEVHKMWPSAGKNAFEQTFNLIVPFASYSVRNKLLFIGEAISHPFVLNYINHIGSYIEKQNLEDWEKRHPGTEMPEVLRRRIQLPWAPDYYLDLSTFSDAARGLRPIFDIGKEQTLFDYTASWVRLINPGMQAIAYSLLNAFNIGMKQQWVAILDEAGYPTGGYELKTQPWLEPWSSDKAELGSGFWFAEAMKKANALGVSGWTEGEVSQMVGQVLLFNGIDTYNKGDVLASFYFNLRDKDPEKAAKWLMETEEGKLVQDWLISKAQVPRDVWDRLRDIERTGKDPSPWFHDQTKEFQERVKFARDEIKAIREAFAVELAKLERGTPEYREMKARMYMAINNVLLNTPELMEANVYGKTAAQWSQQLEDWQTDKLMDTFMEIDKQRPARSSYESTKAYNAAVAKWEHAKQLFLQQYPQVSEELFKNRDALSQVRDVMFKEWDRIFDRISKRGEAIEAAKAIIAEAGRDSAAGKAAQERLDRLYLVQELDFNLLERDYAATYFNDDDFNQLPPGIAGPPTLKGNLLQRASVLADFERRRYEKAVREGRGAQFLAEKKYNDALHAAILKAKGGDPLGKFDPIKFVNAVKSNAYLKSEYFKRNPGKKAKWERTDAYIRHISVWGKLVGAGRWDEANKVWDNLPQWVKDEYYRKHPDRRRRAAQTSQYMGYMQHWVGLFEKGDKKGAMRYFNSLPSWAKERYYAKHPDKRATFEQNSQMTKLMDQYFAADKETQTQILARHPELKKFLAKNSDTKKFAILNAYKQIPKSEPWLRRLFREQHPEIFSQEAIGKAKLRRVYDRLASHPDVLPEFEAWVKTIWATYEEMLKHTIRPLSSYFHSERKVPARKYKRSLSAEEASRLV